MAKVISIQFMKDKTYLDHLELAAHILSSQTGLVLLSEVVVVKKRKVARIKSLGMTSRLMNGNQCQ